MKKHTLPILAILALFAMLLALPASAQTSGDLAVDIPFEFAVGKTVLPAGRYEVMMARASSGVLRIRSADGGPSLFVLTNSAYATDPISESSLVFNRYGTQYFLSKVWTGGSTIGRELGKSAAEREISRELHLAKNASKDQTVSIAGRRH